ncbi:hypothetical protein [Amphibacillus xylanus]|uniref:Tetratricopeptide repeat protein n=1 Tax=Amphibacillus xylanus (strain ATCC 51415 / DSM 6626 / JCM 7361 / LMG 17667 / NBRC 15112 / Ep01) TaxID=698758 RepID=K0J5W6_AMPXN|nr:hypothetical protein [Amphibacillus xylanus]BAM48471.1 hypothetical protein AXY_23390 [Amphibacillus xylanus NBRC 15112]
MMRLSEKSIEELYDLEEKELELLEKEENRGYYHLINIYESILRELQRLKMSAEEIEYVRKKIIRICIDYGTYLKTVYRKDDHSAKTALNRALKYDRKIPIVHYRLGFLSYKEGKYAQSLNYFTNANTLNETYKNKKYCLTNQQLYNTQLYLMNSAFKIAESANETLQELKQDSSIELIPNLEQSSYLAIIDGIDNHLEENAFTVVKQEDSFSCSKEKSEEIIDHYERSNHLILYFADRENSLIYKGRSVQLLGNQAELLRYFLLHTTEDRPAHKHVFEPIITINIKRNEILNATYRQNIRRIREKIRDVGIEETIIENKTINNNPTYYFNHKIPYIIIHRTDTSFLLSV